VGCRYLVLLLTSVVQLEQDALNIIIIWGIDGMVGIAREWFMELTKLCGGFEMVLVGK
jgi:hypothetical protein